MVGWSWEQELVKACFNAGVAVLTLALGWLVGQKLTFYWSLRQKRREIEISTANEFYKLYGEFFAVWKLWNYFVNHGGEQAFPSASRWELLKRACSAEGNLEAIFVKLASERALGESDIEVLGKFRQAYQRLRESIGNNHPLDWPVHDDPGYLTFKRLSYLVSSMILADDQMKLPNEQSTSSLERITSNIWENNWMITDEDFRKLTRN